MVIMLRRTLDNYSNVTATYATYATYATSERFNAVRVARVARVQVATPIKTDILASEVAYD